MLIGREEKKQEKVKFSFFKISKILEISPDFSFP
jgi:hypothetical protein